MRMGFLEIIQNWLFLIGNLWWTGIQIDTPSKKNNLIIVCLRGSSRKTTDLGIGRLGELFLAIKLANQQNTLIDVASEWVCQVKVITIWLFNIAMENGPFMPICRWFTY